VYILTKLKSILLIAASGVLSVIIATAGVEYGAVELGALIYVFVPMMVTAATVIIFFLMRRFLPEHKNWYLIVLIAINIFTGILMRLDFYYNIFNW